jgi:hypothetical protein
MKKYLLAGILLIVAIKNGYGQQKPQYTQYVFNNFLLNPAWIFRRY